MLLDGERWEPISSQYQVIVSRNSTVLIQIPFYWLTLHLPEKRFLCRFLLGW